MASKYPFKLNGYIYSRGTKSGFNRMKRLGIPRPLFRIQDKLAKVLGKFYRELIKKLLADLKQQIKASNVNLNNPLTEDSLEDLLDFFEGMKQEQERQESMEQDFINQVDMGTIADTLQKLWLGTGGNPSESDMKAARSISPEIKEAFEEEQSDYLVRLFDDADRKTQGIIQSFSIDKQKLFNDNMEQLRTLYLDNSIERIAWEQDYIKRAIIKKILDYATGKSDVLDFSGLTKMAFEKGDNMAALFARDQMQRFNKAITLSTFINAGVTKIKWVTCHDVRVRESHKELDGRIFSINELPAEIDDYNCRCGLVPVEWAD